jgi:hypothetical protein
VLKLVIEEGVAFDVIVLDENFAGKMTGSEAILQLRDRYAMLCGAYAHAHTHARARAHPRAPHARAHAYAHTVLRMRARSCRAKTEAHGTVFCVLYRTPRGNEVIISCSGYSRSERAHDVPGADAVWNKPFPDWRDGTMQRQLVELLADRRLAMDRAYGPNRHTGSGTDRHAGSGWEDHSSRGGRA